MTWTTYFTGTEVNINTAVAQIDTNCGLPFEGTNTWDIPKRAYQKNFWFILMPPPDGWRREDGTYFTQEQMINNVSNVNIEESDSSWFPPENNN